jgi:6-phosphogluconate dehydrogenase
MRIPIFENGNTLRLYGKFKDFDGNTVDPTTNLANIQILSSDNEVIQATTAMTREALGTYFYDWTPSSADKYCAEISGSISSNAAKTRFIFDVQETTS